MAYDFYMGSLLLPVPPEAMTTKVNGRNTTFTLINDGEVSVLRDPGLTDIQFSILLPNVRYPFAKYPNGFERADGYLDFFERVMRDKEPFQFIVSRCMPTGALLFDTNTKVTLEGYTIKEKAHETGFDLVVDIALKQYRPYATKTFTVDTPLPEAPVIVEDVRPPSTAASAPTDSGSSKKSTAKSKGYKVQIPGMAVIEVQATSVADAIKKSSGGWKGTIYVNGTAYDAPTGKEITASATSSAPRPVSSPGSGMAQLQAKAEAATGKKATTPPLPGATLTGNAKRNAEQYAHLFH